MDTVVRNLCETIPVTHMMPVPDAHIQKTYCVRIALFVVGTVLLLLLLGYLYQGIQTLSALDQIERNEIIGNGHPM